MNTTTTSAEETDDTMTAAPHDTTSSLTPASEDSYRRVQGSILVAVLVSLILALFLSALDQTIVDTALPRMIADLHGFDRFTWVLTAYLLASTAMIPIVGKLSDQFGRKGLLLAAIALFAVSSGLAGASQTMNQLIILRGVQGLGAGAIQVLVFTLVADIFPPAERARWQGLTSGTFALASVIGPTAGGWMTDHLGWRSVFCVNPPLDVLALVVLLRLLPSDISVRSPYRGWAAVRRVDFFGALTTAGATVCLLLGLTWGGQAYSWTSPQVIGMLTAALLLFLLFLVVERFAVEPILPLGLARNQVVAAGALLALTSNMALLALLVYIPLFIQGVLGQSATNSGVVVTPLTITIALSAVVSGLLVSRTGRYQWVVVVGATIFAVGVLLMTSLTISSSPWVITRNMVVIGVGVGMALPVVTIAVQNAIPRDRLGVVTGSMNYLRSLGSTLGVAVIGTVVGNVFARELPRHLPAAAQQLPTDVLTAATNQQVLVNPVYRDNLVAQVVQGAVAQSAPGMQAVVAQQVTELLQRIFVATQQSLAIAIAHAFWVSFGICGAAVVIALFLKDLPLKHDAEAPSDKIQTLA